MEICGPYLEGHGDVVSSLQLGIIGVIFQGLWTYLLSPHDLLCKHILYTLTETNMETQKGPSKEYSPSKRGLYGFPCLFGGVYPHEPFQSASPALSGFQKPKTLNPKLGGFRV